VETQIVVYFIGWLIFQTLVGALIGKFKGRVDSGVFWSFFLGPIGWLIVALMTDLRQKCPECRGAVIPGARKCKNCGSAIGPASDSQGKGTAIESRASSTPSRSWLLPILIVLVLGVWGLLALMGFTLF
jgi:hypothetical protein